MDKKNKHLRENERLYIDLLLRQGCDLKTIAMELDKAPSTISREIKNHRIKGNEKHKDCDLIKRFPYVCNGCIKKQGCRRTRYYYNPRKAQQEYKFTLKHSRTGIDMTIDEVEHWNEIFEDKIAKKAQSTLHIFSSINFPKTVQTFYNYVHKGIFPSINVEMLPRLYSFKPRNKKERNTKYINQNNPIKKNRTYKHFLNYMEKYPETDVVQMDTVVGKQEDKYCFLTIYFCNSKLMLIYKVLHYKAIAIVEKFNELKSILTTDEFKAIFDVILTDNGWEFSRPDEIEIDKNTGEKLTNIFFCNSYSSYEKGGIERNHEYIRYVLPKGISFDIVSEASVNRLMNNINNTIRPSLDYKSPYEIFIKEYGETIANKLNLKYITKEKVDLSPNIIR